ncbi:MAG: 7-cyano-7-deazaguanine synthase [Candidatus Omnitrophica bacterium]|nr:7-cyano-7-deazaguanine synthase [Candidatus Omnitrophota bacterium]MCF7877290.1 7-cyano-7-deazaguanine synthase [Candidatus Omnitrophota bacterium]MCF7878578.1 7-cyano-7-deazaguanine synthase [Candidatus Omnitrophota bacterium]MCF7892654.1 7-cyano-7-deazaguanine synthase [Candidatus Omnitrophota bacterium]
MKTKAIALLSGGLDSILAAQQVKEEGVEVTALHFNNPFSVSPEGQKKELLGKISNQLGLKLNNEALGKDYLSIIKKPKFGYGKNLNPCIDCRIYMLRKTKQYMKSSGASFIVTGEVLGQRPMSQHHKALFDIEKESGLKEMILRPLSAKLFPETIPEKKGWVERNNLLSISGRSRKIQLQLADKYKIKDYFWAGGGCLLTDSNFCRRLEDIIKIDQLNLANIELLKVGRHFRFGPSFKFIVGRDEKENQKLDYLKKENDYLFKPIDQAGPTGLGRGKINESIKELCTKIITRYSSGDQDFKIRITNDKEKIDEVYKAEMPENNKYRSFII